MDSALGISKERGEITITECGYAQREGSTLEGNEAFK